MSKLKTPKEIYNDIKEGNMDQWDLEGEIDRHRERAAEIAIDEYEFECDGTCETSEDLREEIRDLEEEIEDKFELEPYQVQDLIYLIQKLQRNRFTPEEIVITEPEVLLLDEIYNNIS